MITKRQTILLSFASIISSFSITGITLILLVTNGSRSLITNPCAGIKVVLGVTLFFLSVKYIIVNMNEPLLFQDKPKQQVMKILKSVALLVAVSFFFHTVSVLFGAPVFQSAPETFHFAMLMTVFVGLPCCLAVGPKLDKWVDIFTSDREPGLETVVYLSGIGALLGGWLGAIPIPLDWDRPWQEWPITCSVGCISGYSLGLFLASLYLPHEYKSLFKTKSV